MGGDVRARELEVGVTYWPAQVGPYLWQEFDQDVVRRDLARIGADRIRTVRVMLSWDAFMPSDRKPNPRRMAEFESLLAGARDQGLRIVPVLFAQSLGDCVMLPQYAVDRRSPRQNVRCLTDGRPREGGPRDIYTDPLMLEAQIRWLDAMLAGFAHHPAIAAWEMGHDPAATIRPRRIDDMVSWLSLLAGRVRDQEEEPRLTVSHIDLTSGRAVRLHRLAEHVDILGVTLRPQRLRLGSDPRGAGPAAFIARLAASLAPTAALGFDVGVASGSDEAGDADVRDLMDPGDARRLTAELLQRCAEAGAVTLQAAAWCDWGARLLLAPPADRRPGWTRLGLRDTEGEEKAIAPVWREQAARSVAIAPPAPLHDALDVEAYYANLPDSLRELYATWEGGERDRPAIVG